jgi:hypothetical protein
MKGGILAKGSRAGRAQDDLRKDEGRARGRQGPRKEARYSSEPAQRRPRGAREARHDVSPRPENTPLIWHRRVERVCVIRVRCSLLMLTFVADEDEDRCWSPPPLWPERC